MLFNNSQEALDMVRKAGRPSKSIEPVDTKKRILDAAIRLIRQRGIEAVTLNNILNESGLSNGTFYHHFRNIDDLMITIVKDLSFDSLELATPLEQFPDRICELYDHLIDHYLNLGVEFMKRFYTTRNQGLAAYMCETDGHFAEGTAMARCEQEVEAAILAGILKPDTDPHELSADICTIVKGCLFDWAMSDLTIDVRENMRRILRRYLPN